MKARREITVAAVGILATVTLLVSITALVAMNSGGEARLGPLTLMRLTIGYDRKAEAALAGPAMATPEDRAHAVQWSRNALHEYPYDTSAWLRLAYVDALDHGRLTPEGLADLQRSYDLVAVDSYVGLWRVRFALENSQSLSPDLRTAVRNEVTALWKNGENRNPLRNMRTTVGNPAGRLSIALWLNRLGEGVAK